MNEVAVVNQNQGGQLVDISGLEIFKDVDFKGLSGAIETMAQNNKELAPEEKQMAIQIIDSWQSNVVERLNDHSNDMNGFIALFEVGNYNYHYGVTTFPEETLEAIAQKTGTLTLYQAWKAADAVYEEESLKLKDLERPVPDLETTYQEQLDAQKNYELEEAKLRIRIGKLRHTAERAEGEWKRTVKQDPGIKGLLAKAKSYTRNLNKYTRECESKGQLAKLNISISSEAIRNSLKELLEFAVTI